MKVKTDNGIVGISQISGFMNSATIPEYGSVVSVNRLVRNRFPGGVGTNTVDLS